ncbi:hypothetical protein B0T11DRAFT_292028 [Plectosphaerella cucumerina]|uniref:HNH nuclease domain-containing protein n=1 Tax=Plectosphaerella cucumerina TaxID=40658 RepID=A0A8K0WYP1_9PEZI|nr:hypothetical protein B0T11DRAFT_292028 [Plectosphaerella cucumerina]
MASALEEESFVDATRAFIRRPSTSLSLKAQMTAITDEVPIHDTTKNYSRRDVERRIHIIREIQNRVRAVSPELVFNTMQVAYLLQIDYDQLENFNSDDDAGLLLHILGCVQPFLHTCLSKSSFLDKNMGNAASESSPNQNGKRASNDLTESKVKKVKVSDNETTSNETTSNETTSKDSEADAGRHMAASNKAKVRDRNLCVISQTKFPDNVHIIPYTTTESQTHALNACSRFTKFLQHHDGRLSFGVRHLLFPKKDGRHVVGASDDTFNIMSLNPWFHRGLDKLLFGLKPISTLPRPDATRDEIEYICVEWRYLPIRLAKALEHEHLNYLRQKPTQQRPVALCEVNIDANGISDFFQGHLKNPESQQGFFDASGRLIESGRRFEMPAYKKDAANTCKLLEVSWLARRIASMSGAAEAIDLLSDKPDPRWMEVAWIFQDRAYQRILEEEYADARSPVSEMEETDEMTSSYEDEEVASRLRDRPDPRWTEAARRFLALTYRPYLEENARAGFVVNTGATMDENIQETEAHDLLSDTE